MYMYSYAYYNYYVSNMLCISRTACACAGWPWQFIEMGVQEINTVLVNHLTTPLV